MEVIQTEIIPRVSEVLCLHFLYVDPNSPLDSQNLSRSLTVKIWSLNKTRGPQTFYARDQRVNILEVASQMISLMTT